MLDACSTQISDTQISDAAQDTPPPAQAMQAMRDLIEQLQGEIRFKQTTIEALNFEVARLKRWRFGSSSESLDSTTQAAPMPAQIIDLGLRHRACWRRWWWPSTTITCRCTGRPRSMPARGCTSRARAWRSGWASAACA